MSGNGYDYVGNLLDMVDLSKKADGSQERVSEKAPAPVTKRPEKVASTQPRPSYNKPKKPVRAPWADRMPNADEDYIIPDEALYPDRDDDDDFSK